MEELVPMLQLQMEGAGSAWLRVTGGSMMPMLYGLRDSVCLQPVGKPLQKGDVILYRRDNGAYVLHRILKVRGESLTLCGDNQCRTEAVRQTQVLAVVTAFTRKGKQWTVQQKAYRRYVAFWVAMHPLRWLYIGPRRLLGKLRAAILRKKSRG